MTKLINELEEEHDNRFQMINGMNGLIKAMARSETCRDVECQVGDGELFWDVRSEIRQEEKQEVKETEEKETVQEQEKSQEKEKNWDLRRKNTGSPEKQAQSSHGT